MARTLFERDEQLFEILACPQGENSSKESFLRSSEAIIHCLFSRLFLFNAVSPTIFCMFTVALWSLFSVKEHSDTSAGPWVGKDGNPGQQEDMSGSVRERSFVIPKSSMSAAVKAQAKEDILLDGKLWNGLISVFCKGGGPMYVTEICS